MLLRYLKGNESESKSQHNGQEVFVNMGCCVTSKVMNLKANHNPEPMSRYNSWVVALPQR